MSDTTFDQHDQTVSQQTNVAGDMVGRDKISVSGNGNVVGDHNVVTLLENRAQDIPPARIADLTERYCRAVEGKWQYLSTDGVQVPLCEVFVLLQALEKPPARNPDHPEDLSSIPERLGHAGLTERQERPEHRLPLPPPTPVELSQALKEARHLVLLGEPGSGKSTALQFIGLCFVHEDWARMRLFLEESRIPVELNLRACAETLARHGPTIEEAMAAEVGGYLRDSTPEERLALVRAWIAAHRLLLLLDGLDEVPERLRAAVREEISHFVGQRVTCRVVLSSRSAGNTPLAADFKAFTLKPFEGIEEAQHYLTGWVRILRPDWNAEVESKRLAAEMGKHPALCRVMNNPLLLRLAAQIYAHNERQIAATRTDLYTRYLDDLWERAVERGTERKRKDTVWQNLEDLAWQMHSGKTPTLAAETEILVREQMGLVARVGQSWVFSHTTLQEYFVAQRLKRAWEENREGAWAFLRPRLHLTTWREPLLLLVSWLNEDASQHLIRCVLKARSPYEKRLRRDKLLVIALSIELGEIVFLLQMPRDVWWVHRAIVEALGDISAPEAVSALIQSLQDEDEYVRGRAVEALGRIGASEAVPSLIQTLQDKALWVREAAAESLGVIGTPEAVPALLQALRDENGSVREAAAKSLGRIGTAESVTALCQVLQDEILYVRLAATEALGKIGAVEVIPSLINMLRDGISLVRLAAIEALGKIGAVEAIPSLINMLRDGILSVRWAAAEALGKIGAPAIPALHEALQDESKDVREAVIWSLGIIGVPKSIPILLQVLRDGDTDVYREAAYTLGKILERLSDTRVSPTLYQGLQHEEPVTRDAAVEMLMMMGGDASPTPCQVLPDEEWPTVLEKMEKIGDAHAISTQLQALQDRDPEKRRMAARALGTIKAVEAIPTLCQALQDEFIGVCCAAAWALGLIRSAEAVPALLAALQDEEHWVRMAAAEALGRIGDVQAIPILHQTLRDKMWWVRQEATGALGEIGNTQSIPALCVLLQDDSEHVHIEAVEALGKIGHAQTIPALCKSLQDMNWRVRRAAVKALGKIGDPSTLPALQRALQDENSQVGVFAVEAIKTILISLPQPKDANERQQHQQWLYAALRSDKLGYKDKILIAERLDALELKNSPYQDPFEPLKPPRWQRALRSTGIILLASAGVGLVALLALFSGVLGDALKKGIGPSIAVWVQAYLWITVGLLAVLASLGALLTWGVDQLKETWEK